MLKVRVTISFEVGGGGGAVFHFITSSILFTSGYSTATKIYRERFCLKLIVTSNHSRLYRATSYVQGVKIHVAGGHLLLENWPGRAWNLLCEWLYSTVIFESLRGIFDGGKLQFLC